MKNLVKMMVGGLRFIKYAVALYIASVSFVFASDIFVDCTNGNDANDGSEATPKKTLVAIASAIESDTTIHLSQGVHLLSSEISFANLENISFVGAGKDVTFVEPAEGVKIRHMTMSECNNVSISGITFRKGCPEFAEDEVNDVKGGSILLVNSPMTTIRDCNFFDNSLCTTGNTASGGAICIDNTNLDIKNCLFERNEARCNSGAACGGAVAQANLATDNLNLYCENSVFRFNRTGYYTSGSVESYGVAIKPGISPNASISVLTVTNCLMTMNDGFRRPGDRAFALSVIGSYHANADYGDRNTKIVIKNSTIAYNVCRYPLSMNKGSATISQSVVCGQRSPRLSSSWINVTYDDSLVDHEYDAIGRVTFKTNVVINLKPIFNPDMSLAETSPGYEKGIGYKPTSPSLSARTFYVNPEVASSGNGLTIGSPFNSLTDALSVVKDGDTIHLAQGVYNSTKERFPIRISNLCNVKILGDGSGKTIFEPGEGYKGGESCMMVTNIFASTIGGFSIRGFDSSTNATDSSALRVDTGTYSTICDVKISDCVKRPSEDGNLNGAHLNISHMIGVLVDGVSVKNCTAYLLNTNSVLNGGVAYFDTSMGIARNCEFVGNLVAAPTVNGMSLFIGCEEADSNTSIWCFRNCLVADNTRLENPDYNMTRNGDIAYLRGSYKNTKPRFENCTLVGGDERNDLGIASGGVWDSGASFCARNTIFANIGTGFKQGYGANVFYDCIVVTNSSYTVNLKATSSYSNYLSKAQPIPGEGNIIYLDKVEDVFKKPSKGNYSLKQDSPAIDKGKVLNWMTGDADSESVDWFTNDAQIFDLAGNKRLVKKSGETALPDIGCYEYSSSGFNIIVR